MHLLYVRPSYTSLWPSSLCSILDLDIVECTQHFIVNSECQGRQFFVPYVAVFYIHLIHISGSKQRHDNNVQQRDRELYVNMILNDLKLF